MIRKWILFLACIMIVVMTAVGCNPNTQDGNSNPTETGAQSEADDLYQNEFRVGFARNDITPKSAVPLAGYGNTGKRLSNGFLDYTYLSCIAFSDADNRTLLWFSADMITSATNVTESLRQEVSEATGLPVDHILMTATHTHSNIDVLQTGFESVNLWIRSFINTAVKTSLEALSDRKPASFRWGTADLTGYNFVRHYFTDLNESVGDNHGTLAKGQIVRHTTEANHLMYILEISREDGAPLLLTNWRAHPTITGGSTRYDISSDFVGSVRNEIEGQTAYKFIYYQGDAGNMNPKTRLSSDVEYNPPTEFREYGKEVAELILNSIGEDGLTEIKTGPIQTVQTSFTGRINHDWDGYVTVARTLREFWNETGDSAETIRRAAEYGIEGPYHAGAIVSRASLGVTADVEIHATRIGDFVFINAPFELFDQNGNYIRENSPSPYMMVVGYSNQSWGYLPSQYGYDYGCYESDTGRFEAGTGELLASKYVELLKELYK